MQQQLVEHSARLFERLGCRDYARFDFRADARGEIKLLEVNPNPGWCWDGKLNLMAGFQGCATPSCSGRSSPRPSSGSRSSRGLRRWLRPRPPSSAGVARRRAPARSSPANGIGATGRAREPPPIPSTMRPVPSQRGHSRRPSCRCRGRRGDVLARPRACVGIVVGCVRFAGVFRRHGRVLSKQTAERARRARGSAGTMPADPD